MNRVDETQSATISKMTELHSTTNNIVIYLHSATVSLVVNHDAILLVTTVYSLPLSSQFFLFLLYHLIKIFDGAERLNFYISTYDVL